MTFLLIKLNRSLIKVLIKNAASILGIFGTKNTY